MSACLTPNSSRHSLKKYSSEGPGLSASTKQKSYKKLPNNQNKKGGRRRLPGPSFNSFQWPRWLIDSRTLKKYTWTWSASAWHGPVQKASQNQPKSKRIWYNRTFLLLEEQWWWDWGAVQVSDGGGEIPISHCEIHGQTSLEIDFLKNSADNKNIFKCNLFWWPVLHLELFRMVWVSAENDAEREIDLVFTAAPFP